jgi:hypothetical protein
VEPQSCIAAARGVLGAHLVHSEQNTRKQPRISPRRVQVVDGKRQMPKLPCERVREDLLDAAYDHMLSGDAREISAVIGNRAGMGEAMVDRALVAEALRWRAKARNLWQMLLSAGPLSDAAMRDMLAELEDAA